MKKHFARKALGIVSAAAMTLTSFAGASASSLTNANILLTDKTVTGGNQYISTYLKADYFAKKAFQVKYKVTKLDSDGKVTVKDDKGNEEVKAIDYTDTFDFRVFDMNWGGWNPTGVGEANPVVGEVYTATASIADIESKLAEGSTVQGINFETGNIGDAQVEVISLEYVNADVEGKEVTFTGSWTKGSGGTFTKESGTGNISTNEWNIQVSDICAYGFEDPTVDVTVKYNSIPSDHVQAEILAGVGGDAQPIVPYYPQIKQNMLNSDNEITFTTEFNANLTAMTVCYDACTVKKIHIYDNTAGDKEVSVTGKTADEIAANMGVAWNLGNALDAVSADGKADERAWNTATTTKKLIQAVKGQGFNTVRIPVSFLDKITSDNKVDPDYLARIKQVVDYAYSMGMYAVIDMHNDGGEISAKWLDITKTDGEFTAIKDKFASIWKDIAIYFKDYDQKLLFEGYNELMNGNYNSNPETYQIANVNALAQAFVTAVRSAGGENADRVLVVAGYNTNIDQTISGFVKPADSSEERLMLSVHYYDPYDFTLNEKSSDDDWGTVTELTYMRNQINKIAAFAKTNGMPVFIGEYGPIDKNNTAERGKYCYRLNYYAKTNADAKIITAYWDNGVVGEDGSALFDRVNNSVTTTGTEIISQIKKGAAGTAN